MDGIYMDSTEVEKRCGVDRHRYVLYRFRDVHTCEVHYIYDHRCNRVLLEELGNSVGLVYRVTGVMTVSGMEHFCNLDGLGIIEGGGMRWIYRRFG